MLQRITLQHTVLVCTFVFYFLLATGAIAQPVTTFERTYADPAQVTQTNGIYGMDQTFDHGYIMVGTQNYGNPGGTHLIRTDLNGQYLWNTLYTDPSWDEDYSVIEANAGNNLYWTTGIIDWYGFWGLYHFHLTNVAPGGVTNWTRHYVPRYGPDEQGFMFSGSTSVIELSTGEIVMAGWGGFPGGATDFHIIKTSAAGNIVWAAMYGNSAASVDQAWCVRELPDGHLLVVGTGNIFTSGSNQAADVMWMKINATNGAAMWGPNPIKLFSIPGSYCAGYSVAIDPTPGKPEAVIVGERRYIFPLPDGGVAKDGLVVKVNLLSGALAGYRTFDFSSSGNPDDIFRSVCFDPASRTYTIVGKTGNSLGERALALKINSGLAPVWAHTYDGNGLEWAEFRHVDMVSYPFEPNAFAAAGQVNDPAWWINNYLARISPQQGLTGCEYTPDVEPAAPPAQFSQNPVYDLCNGSWVINPATPPPYQCSIWDNLKTLSETYPDMNDPFRCAPATEHRKRSAEEAGAETNVAMELKVLPNTVSQGETFAVFFHSEKGSDCKVLVSDLLGRKMFERNLQGNSLSEIIVNTDSWHAGVYIVTVSRGDGELHSARLVVH